MKYLYGLALLSCVVLWSSCRNDFESEPSTGDLEFSRDTVYLDTIFTNIGSSTYNLKVYNRSDDDIVIPSVRLGLGESSDYRLNVDGLPGKSFDDVVILAKDSIFVFVETTFDINTVPSQDGSFLYTDKILFDSGGNEQDVDLVTLVQDATFLFPEQASDGTIETLNLGMDANGDDVLIEGFFLEDDQLTFTNDRPYVIYGYAAVPPNRTLTIEPGARIHFHANSGILVANEASIKANGAPSSDPVALENQIIFESDRLEPVFSEVPGQWGTIWCTAGSTDNEFSYVTVKNSVVGILMDSNDGDRTLTLSNVEIYNAANVGLLSRTGNIYGENVVINNCGQTSLSASFGGTYEFNHCTFANYWRNNSRTFPSVQLDNVIQTGETTFETEPLNAIFRNCIIYGNEQRELGFVVSPDDVFNYNFTNTLIRFEDPNGDFTDNPLYDFGNSSLYTNSVINIDPAFFDTTLNNFNIEAGVSGAEGIGLPSVAPPIDLNGTPRDATPDAGAYEATMLPPPPPSGF